MKRNFCLCIMFMMLLILPVSCGRNSDSPKVAMAAGNISDIDLPLVPEDLDTDFPSDGTYVLYTVNSSAAGSITGTALQKVQGQGTAEVRAAANLGYRFVCWSDGSEDPVRRGDTADENRVITAIFDYDKLEMPILSIVTETNQDVESKTEYIGATLTLLGAKSKYNFENLEIQIRGRGNFTWGLEKKSYKMKLPRKQSLLGLGKGKSKKWVLLANHCDQSLLRNYVCLNLAGEMPSIAWSPDCTSVEVYLNGEYRGVYLLVEEIDVGKNKVNVSEEVTGMGVDIGYLIEMSGNAKNVIFSAGGKSYQMHNDLSENPKESQEQYDYIRDYVQQCWDAVNEGDEKEIGRLIDIDSMVDAYLMEEIVKNMDVGWDSFYLYKNVGGKLTFGPLWDFDLALGNCNQGCETYDSLYAAYVMWDQSNPWFYTMMNYEWFRERVVERFDDIRKICDGLSDMVIEEAEEYYNSFCRNFDKWHIFGQTINRETEQITSLSTYKQHYTFLAQWIDRRLEWLDECFHEEAFLKEWTGYGVSPNGNKPGEFRGNEEAGALLDGYTGLSVTASSIDATIPGFGNEGVINLFDGSILSKYCAVVGDGDNIGTVDITFSLTEAASLSGYVFCTANDTSLYSDRNPKKWVLYGKAPDGSWEEVDTCKRSTMGLDAEDYCCYGRFCTDAGVYTDYKLTITHDALIQLSEILLFGEPLPSE